MTARQLLSPPVSLLRIVALSITESKLESESDPAKRLAKISLCPRLIARSGRGWLQEWQRDYNSVPGRMTIAKYGLLTLTLLAAATKQKVPFWDV